MGEVKGKSMTLKVDVSAMVAQMKIASEVMNEFEPLLSELTEQRAKQSISDFIVALNNLVVGYYVTTFFTDGTRKTIRCLRYRGNIKNFTTAFWTKEVCILH